MRRRDLIRSIGIAAVTWPLVAPAAHTQSRRRRLGVLLIGTQRSRTAETQAHARWLEELGWKTTVNLDLDYRWAAGNREHLRDQAADIASLSPDVILVQSNPGLRAMRQAAPSTPIVFVMVADPVGSGFVNSLARPGGAITGFANFEPPMGGKWLEVRSLVTRSLPSSPPPSVSRAF